MPLKHETSKVGSRKRTPRRTRSDKWVLRLYVAGQTAKSVLALKNLTLICEDQLKGRYRIEVVDLVKRPQLAHDHQILALPTLVRELPSPIRSIIGDLSNTARVLVGLELVDHGS